MPPYGPSLLHNLRLCEDEDSEEETEVYRSEIHGCLR